MFSKILISLTALSVLLLTLVTLHLLVTATAGDAPPSGSDVQEHLAVESPQVVAQLQGTWGANFIWLEGGQFGVACDAPDNWQVILKGNRVTVLGPKSGRKELIFEGTFSAAWVKGVGEIDFTFQGDEKGKTATGLFKFEGDELWLCVSGMGKVYFYPSPPGERPTSFKPKGKQCLFVMRRVRSPTDLQWVIPY
jgi:uncharacterized protein (TIGR03067 family)